MKKKITTLKTNLITLRALRKKVSSWIHRKTAGQKGSAVVEAALIVPLFFCAVCTLLAIGQMLFAQAQIWYCLSQTADQMVQMEEIKEGDTLLEISGSYAIFHSLMRENGLCNLCIKGGSKGIILTQNTKENELDLTASYYLKVPVPYFTQLGFLSKKTVSRRLFSGYIAHEEVADSSDPTVYIAQYGRVYHTTMSCSKICIKIADPMLIGSLMNTKKYRKCEKCMKGGEIYSFLYITLQGDACHSNLSCSGLKRTIKAVKLSEAGGLGPCKNCGKE